MKQPKVIFKDSNHSYFIDGVKTRSVSSIIKEFEQPFDREYWSYNSALKRIIPDFKELKREILESVHMYRYPHFIKPDPELIFPLMEDYIGDEQLIKATVEEVLDEWDKDNIRSTEMGTAFHLEREAESIARGYETNPWTNVDFPIINPSKQYDNQSIHDNLADLEDGYYPELLIFNEEIRLEKDPDGPKGLCGQADKVWIETVDGVRYVDIDDYKGFSLDTLIPTIDGFKPMKDIRPGDMVYDGEGVPTEVEGVSKIKNERCYKVVFDNNQEVICDYDHRWEVTIRKRDSSCFDTIMTTEDMLSYMNNKKSNQSPLKIKRSSVYMPKVNLPIDPYVLGLWLGDGSRDCGTITCINKEIWNEVENRGFKISNNHNDGNEKSEPRTVFGLRTLLSESGLLNNKHIPQIYLRSSSEQRLDLLRGFMDADGHFHRKRKRCVMNTTRQWQADSIIELVSSLGIKATKFNYLTSGFGKTNIPAISICFTSEESPFLVRNKDYESIISNLKGGNKLRKKFDYIKSIEEVDSVPTKCLSVKSHLSTFLVTKSFIKTHNTNKVKNMSKQSGLYNMKEPLDHLKDNSLCHYNLQSTIYAGMMKLAGFTPRNLSITHYTEYDVKTANRIEFEYLDYEFNKIFGLY